MVIARLKEFPTHIAKTDNKIKENKLWKINNQGLYSGTLGRFQRAIVVKNLHNYIIENLPKIKITSKPVRVKILVKTVINHGDIRVTKKGISWKTPKKDYIPTWDIDNFSVIWLKVIKDSISLSGMMPDDNVSFIRGGAYDLEFVDEFKNREIIISIEKI